MKTLLIATGMGLVLANYVYQFFLDNPHWLVAFDRSYYQVVALLAVAANLWIKKRLDKQPQVCYDNKINVKRKETP